MIKHGDWRIIQVQHADREPFYIIQKMGMLSWMTVKRLSKFQGAHYECDSIYLTKQDAIKAIAAFETNDRVLSKQARGKASWKVVEVNPDISEYTEGGDNGRCNDDGLE